MAARPIELHVQLPLVFSAARESFQRVVRELGETTGSPERHTLAVYLRDLHAGVRGEIRVPITMEIAEHNRRFECTISIRAASDRGYFPTFEGTLSINPLATQSELWLQGTYLPPLASSAACSTARCCAMPRVAVCRHSYNASPMTSRVTSASVKSGMLATFATCTTDRLR